MAPIELCTAPLLPQGIPSYTARTSDAVKLQNGTQFTATTSRADTRVVGPFSGHIKTYSEKSSEPQSPLSQGQLSPTLPHMRQPQLRAAILLGATESRRKLRSSTSPAPLRPSSNVQNSLVGSVVVPRAQPTLLSVRDMSCKRTEDHRLASITNQANVSKPTLLRSQTHAGLLSPVRKEPSELSEPPKPRLLNWSCPIYSNQSPETPKSLETPTSAKTPAPLVEPREEPQLPSVREKSCKPIEDHRFASTTKQEDVSEPSPTTPSRFLRSQSHAVLPSRVREEPSDCPECSPCDVLTENIDGSKQPPETPTRREIPTSAETPEAYQMYRRSAATCHSQNVDNCNRLEQKLHYPTSRHHNALELVIFDFDCTLSSFHVFGSLAGTTGPEPKLTVPPPHAKTERGQVRRLSELDADSSWGPGVFARNAFGDPSRIAQLRSLLELLRTRGVECMILSRGMVQTMKICLEEVGLLSFFAKIIGSPSYSLGATDYDLSAPASAEQAEVRSSDKLGIGWHYALKPKAELIKELKEERGLGSHQIMLIDDNLQEIAEAQSICRTIHVSSGRGVQEADMQQLRRSMLVKPHSYDDSSTRSRELPVRVTQ